MSEEDLLVHVFYLRSVEEKLVAAVAVEEAKSSVGEGNPTKSPTNINIRIRRGGSSPSESFSNNNFCPPEFKGDVFMVPVPPPAYWIGLS